MRARRPQAGEALGSHLQRRYQRKMDYIERRWDFLARNGWQAEAGLVLSRRATKINALQR